MSNWTLTWQTRQPSRPKVIDRRPAHDTRTYAQHLRGKVRIVRGCYYFGVINTTTGEYVSSDNGCVGLASAFEDAEFQTAVARAVWMRGVKHKGVQRKKGKR